MDEPVRHRADLLVDARDTLGECALWCEREQVLWWTDIEGAVLQRWCAADGTRRRLPMSDRVGSFALCEDPDLLLLGRAGGVALHRVSSGASTPLVPVEPGTPTRINDGRCDRQGRFVFGMFNQAADAAAIGHWYRVHPDLQVERLPLPPVSVANDLAFSPDGRRMYLTDSPTRTVWVRDYHADGRIGPAEVFVRLAPGEGFPDGACTDAEGGLWIACWHGHAVRRYDAQGRLSDLVELPVSQVTCPALGGPGRDRLFITSARTGLKPERLAAEPLAGGLFSAAVRHQGLPEVRFATPLAVA